MIETLIGLPCPNNSCYRASNTDHVPSSTLVKERDSNENYKTVPPTQLVNVKLYASSALLPLHEVLLVWQMSPRWENNYVKQELPPNAQDSTRVVVERRRRRRRVNRTVVILSFQEESERAGGWTPAASQTRPQPFGRIQRAQREKPSRIYFYSPTSDSPTTSSVETRAKEAK